MSIRRMLAVLLLCVGALLGEGDGRPLEQPARRSDDNTAQTIVRVVNLDFTSANNITFSLHGDNSFDFSLGPGGCYDVLGPDFTDANAFYVSNPEGYTSINWHAGIFFSPETAYTCCGGATNRWWHMQPTQCPYDKKENTYLCNGTAAAYVPFGAWYQSFSTVQSPASIAVFNAAGSQSPVSWTPSALVPYMLVWTGLSNKTVQGVVQPFAPNVSPGFVAALKCGRNFDMNQVVSPLTYKNEGATIQASYTFQYASEAKLPAPLRTINDVSNMAWTSSAMLNITYGCPSGARLYLGNSACVNWAGTGKELVRQLEKEGWSHIKDQLTEETVSKLADFAQGMADMMSEELTSAAEMFNDFTGGILLPPQDFLSIADFVARKQGVRTLLRTSGDEVVAEGSDMIIEMLVPEAGIDALSASVAEEVLAGAVAAGAEEVTGVIEGTADLVDFLLDFLFDF